MKAEFTASRALNPSVIDATYGAYAETIKDKVRAEVGHKLVEFIEQAAPAPVATTLVWTERQETFTGISATVIKLTATCEIMEPTMSRIVHYIQPEPDDPKTPPKRYYLYEIDHNRRTKTLLAIYYTQEEADAGLKEAKAGTHICQTDPWGSF